MIAGSPIAAAPIAAWGFGWDAGMAPTEVVVLPLPQYVYRIAPESRIYRIAPESRSFKVRRNGSMTKWHTNNCGEQIRFYPGSKKTFSWELSRTEHKTATVSTAEWTVPSGFTNEAQSEDALLVQLTLSASGGVNTSGWLVLKATMSDGDIIHTRMRCLIDYGGH